MTRNGSDWPSLALLTTIERVFEAALPVLLARSAANEQKDTLEVSMDLSRTLVELASDGISDYAQLLDRAIGQVQLGAERAEPSAGELTGWARWASHDVAANLSPPPAAALKCPIPHP